MTQKPKLPLKKCCEMTNWFFLEIFKILRTVKMGDFLDRDTAILEIIILFQPTSTVDLASLNQELLYFLQ